MLKLSLSKRSIWVVFSSNHPLSNMKINHAPEFLDSLRRHILGMLSISKNLRKILSKSHFRSFNLGLPFWSKMFESLGISWRRLQFYQISNIWSHQSFLHIPWICFWIAWLRKICYKRRARRTRSQLGMKNYYHIKRLLWWQKWHSIHSQVNQVLLRRYLSKVDRNSLRLNKLRWP